MALAAEKQDAMAQQGIANPSWMNDVAEGRDDTQKSLGR
jgi:hypothetical protein